MSNAPPSDQRRRDCTWSSRARTKTSSAYRATTGCALLVISLLGCDPLGNEHPYTPFGTASGPAAPKVEPTRLFDPAPVATPRKIPFDAQIAPPQTRRWSLAGRSIVAPKDLVFRLGLTGALKGGEEGDILAWAVGTPAAPSNGELWLFPNSGKPRRIATFPGFVPAGPGCHHGTRLTRTGPSTVTLDILATCRDSLLPRSPVRSLTVLAPLRPKPLVTSFRVAAPAAGESVSLGVDTGDLDSDGRDDITLSVSVTDSNNLNSPTANARFQWIDRAAGLSRNTAEPLASFRGQAQATLAAALKKGSSEEEIEHRVASLRRLYSAICQASGTFRLYDGEGDGLACGSLRSPFQVLTKASVEVSLRHQQPVHALAALERHSWFSAAPPASGKKFTKALFARISEQLTLRRVIKLVPLKAVPQSAGSVPRYSPLSFHADGSLLLLTESGVVRSAPDGRYEYNASEELDPWPTVVVSPRGDRLTGVGLPCARAEISWLRTSEGGAFLPPLISGTLAPRPGGCGSRGLPLSPAIVPIGWSGTNPEAFVGLTRIGSAVTRPPLGSATSPNGVFSIVPNRWGLVVSGGGTHALWRFEDPALPRQLKDCVVSNNAQAAACLLAGRAYVVLPEPNPI